MQKKKPGIMPARFASLLPCVTVTAAYCPISLQACAQASAQLDVRAGPWSTFCIAEKKEKLAKLQRAQRCTIWVQTSSGAP